jgi:hypothetical protein
MKEKLSSSGGTGVATLIGEVLFNALAHVVVHPASLRINSSDKVSSRP